MLCVFIAFSEFILYMGRYEIMQNIDWLSIIKKFWLIDGTWKVTNFRKHKACYTKWSIIFCSPLILMKYSNSVNNFTDVKKKQTNRSSHSNFQWILHWKFLARKCKRDKKIETHFFFVARTKYNNDRKIFQKNPKQSIYTCAIAFNICSGKTIRNTCNI